MIYKKYLQNEITMTILQNTCNNLIENTVKELEDVSNSYS
jgi:hypothetical protein